MLMLDPELQRNFSAQESIFAAIMALRGEVYRTVKNRCTSRVILNNKPYFLKQHFGVGWREIFKNLVQWRLPIVSAKNEWLAIKRLQQCNIAVPRIAGFGCRGWNPATRQSFLLTHEIPPHISLEDLCKDWKKTPPPFRLKQALIREVATIARVMHENGINHRDFYICHFLLDRASLVSMDKPQLTVIDLHRAGIRQKVPTRWVIKDLAGLYFSSKEAGLTSRDLLRFMKIYRNQPLATILTQEKPFWQRITERGNQLYQRHTTV